MNTSKTWNFTTMQEPTNEEPDEPENPSPADNATGVTVNPTLSVHVSDPDGDMLDVTFYDAATGNPIGSDQCISDCTAEATWYNLDHDTEYSWYVTVSDDEFEVTSDTWTFTTEPIDVSFEMSVNGGIGFNVNIKNTGTDTIEDVKWWINVTNRGLLNRVDKTYTNIYDFNPGGEFDKEIRLFKLARVQIDVTVTHEDLDSPQTETFNGFLFGFFAFF